MSSIQDLLATLVSFPSITPDDAGCQDFIISYLESLGFQCQRFNNPPVSNCFARWGKDFPLLLFAGHTDVVPIGDSSKWVTDPFVLSSHNGHLVGRGTADMKGSL